MQERFFSPPSSNSGNVDNDNTETSHEEVHLKIDSIFLFHAASEPLLKTSQGRNKFYNISRKAKWVVKRAQMLFKRAIVNFYKNNSPRVVMQLGSSDFRRTELQV